MAELEISFGSGFYVGSYFGFYIISCFGSSFYLVLSLDLIGKAYFSLVFSSFLIFFFI